MHFDLKIHINFKQKICRILKDKTMSVGYYWHGFNQISSNIFTWSLNFFHFA